MPHVGLQSLPDASLPVSCQLHWGDGSLGTRVLGQSSPGKRPGGPPARRHQGLWGSPGSARPAGLRTAAAPSWLCSGRAAQPRAELCPLPVERGRHAGPPQPQEGPAPLEQPQTSAYLVLCVHVGPTCDEVLQALTVPCAHGHVQGSAPDLGGVWQFLLLCVARPTPTPKGWEQCQLRAARCSPDGPPPRSTPSPCPGP